MGIFAFHDALWVWFFCGDLQCSPIGILLESEWFFLDSSGSNSIESFFSMAMDDNKFLRLLQPSTCTARHSIPNETIFDPQLQNDALLQKAQGNSGKFLQQMLAQNIQVDCYTAQPGDTWKNLPFNWIAQ
jgi:hypothetical protein